MESTSTVRQSEVYYSGHVQGVGFRANARYLAKRYPVTGFVRNLPDGRVHMVVEGQPEVVKQLLADIAKSMEDQIADVVVDTRPATGKYDGFSIA
jgi:acylphosphatase